MSSIWTVRRSATDTKVAGLCGGVAEHWDVDPVLVRVGWVLLALSGGVGVVLYLAGWLLVPLAGQTNAPVDDLLGPGVRRWPKRVWVALVIAACVLVSTFGTLSPFGVGPAAILACIWYFGFYRSRSRRPGSWTAASPPPAALPAANETAPTTPFTEAAEAWRRRIEQHAAEHGAPLAPAATVAQPTWPTMPAAASPVAPAAVQPFPQGPAAVVVAPAPDPELVARTAFWAEPDPVGLYSPPLDHDEGAPSALAVPPPRGGDRLAARRLRLSGLTVLGLALAGLGLADQSGVTVTPAVYAATALLVVGLTLVAATWLGRARGLLPLGFLLVPVVVATSVLGPVTHLDHWADASRSYVQVRQLPAAGDSLEAGQLVVDLSHLPTQTDAAYTAHVGTGRLEVVTPPGANVVVDYRVGVGEVRVDGQQVMSGGHLSGTTGPTASSLATSPQPVLTLHVSVDRGQLEVRR